MLLLHSIIASKLQEETINLMYSDVVLLPEKAT